MNRKIAVLLLSLAVLMSLIVIIIEIAPMVKAPTIWYVDDSNPGPGDGSPGDPFQTIQAGVDAAQPGDTVFVYNGTYHENVTVNKTVNLAGEGWENTYVNGSGSGDVVSISADWVNVTGFTVKGSGSAFGDAGIELLGVHNCSIFDNNVSNNEIGLYLKGASNNTISDNNVSSNAGVGIYLISSSNSTLIGNNVSSIWRGIYLEKTDNNTLSGNYVSSKYGGDGITLFMSSNNSLIKNYITDNVNGIYLMGSANSIITGNDILSNTAFGISLSPSSNNTITDNNISDNDGGIYLGYSSNNNLTDNTFVNDGIFMQGFQVEQWNTHDIDISNTVNGRPVHYWKNQTGGTIPPGAGQVILANCTNVSVENQELTHCTVGIELGFSSHVEINSNNVSNTKYGMWLNYSDRNNITNNNISNIDWKGLFLGGSNWNNITENEVSTSEEDGITLSGSDNNTLSCNDVFLIERYAIYIPMSSNNTIKYNNISGNNGNGIYLRSSSNNSIFGNEIFSNLNNGILLDMSSYNNITNNNVSWNSAYGIYLYMSSNYNRLEDNNLQINNWGIHLSYSSNNSMVHNYVASNDAGIYLYSSLNNTITRNNILLNNGFGSYLSKSLNNRIFHNNLIDNLNQAYDDRDSNLWNHTYPSGGNYWSDYDGIDLNSTPHQDTPPPDGIGDTPYVIDSDSQDNYPLMSPFGNCTFLYPGWNLISIPFIQPETNLCSVLRSIDGSYDAVQYYNISSGPDRWKVNRTIKPSHQNDLDDIDHTMGFWIRITEPGCVLFEYFGFQPVVNQTISLRPGWNMVGYPSQTSYNRTDGLNNLTFGVEVDSIWAFNAATKIWEEIGPSDYFEPGRGYWLHAITECGWEVPL